MSATSTIRSRSAWLLSGIGLAAFAIYEVAVHDLGPVPLVVFGSFPDLPLVVAMRRDGERSELTRRALVVRDLAHRPIGPLVVILVALVLLLGARLLSHDPVSFETARAIPLILYVAGIAWLAHIAVERGSGIGQRHER